ncbi:D-alanyl-D-alanine carboxypeptidase [Sulfitobacter sp. KE34]|jgi:D-alanyl-D-alanine carboxypeptidase|uniref:D-alanyl-D-alanine carboxypeptidase n=1 Tax=Sulfitobacter faviae TaxID=1775881 RepID=A0AAX3LP35_9RHOB|nr:MULTISPECIES: D-alanyl-D-alanine carboxypeptidase family protein [Sulfitobacter]MDF3349575.1 D-alanyl-D-alanine carboxypeptidase [Sulfitobacter sp. KE12]MDF3353247.1 D-alanyl-D-alanine carboxypeptidase [Sulfitobacter sp. KE27]MDF3356894.1 D-alanyl-D-alanine carboxypeptidase [Sulfitobacter sp. KE33]MDF3362197.1 D-alanyl-D-alanine carboxypeptidase [Sulfitobacter sp. Ks41]MDF3364318.1 D-alanyl-D-alanine carboxypeptidase [Sulfitobacter sp. Ks34]
MKARRIQPARYGLFLFAALWVLVLLPLSAIAAPYAAYVIDARTGKEIHAENADTRLHPASLTKMMTLYIAFQAVERGEISLDTQVTISKNAASEPPSKLGMRPGQKIALRYLIRAAAVKSANDAATAIGEAIGGSEAAFARRMNRTAKQLGMTRTTFKNMHGLTESGHLSTARDMTRMGRHLLYDYPQYYNLFSRITADAGVRKVSHTNRRFLGSYKGADGIKTGYTRAAGFNLTASAERGNERIIVTVFGGKSTASRNAKVAELMDLGFRRAPSSAPLRKPVPPVYADVETAPGAAGKTIRLVGAVTTSKRPQLRPRSDVVVVATAAAPEATSVVSNSDITAALREAVETPPTPPAAAPTPEANEAEVVIAAAKASPRPEPRPQDVKLAVQQAVEQEIVTRVSTSGGRHWGVNVGRFPSRYAAEKVLLKTALAEMSTLDGTLRKVVRRPQGFDANFLGMSRESADLACRRLAARNVSCFMIGPSEG